MCGAGISFMVSTGCSWVFFLIFCFLGISATGGVVFRSLRFMFMYGILPSFEKSMPPLVTESNAFCIQSWHRFMPPGMDIIWPALLSGLRHM